MVAEVMGPGYFSRHRLNWERTCIVVPNTPTTVTVRLHTMDPGRNYASGNMRVSVATGDTHPRCCDGSLPPSTPITCECQDLGNIDLREMTLGCITGTLQSGSGPMWGRISIRAGGDEISMLSLPGPHSETCQADPSLPECNGEFCANLPMSFLDSETEIEFVGPSGNTISVLPDRLTLGQECGIGFCQQIGSPQPVCTQEFGCVSAGFTHEVIPESVNCPPERPFELRFDGSPTTGPVALYRWDFELDPEWVAGLADPSDAPEFVPGHFVGHNLETVSRCVEAGRYKVQLNAMVRISPNFLLSNVARKTISRRSQLSGALLFGHLYARRDTHGIHGLHL